MLKYDAIVKWQQFYFIENQLLIEYCKIIWVDNETKMTQKALMY
jgi:hypothetical protein